MRRARRLAVPACDAGGLRERAGLCRRARGSERKRADASARDERRGLRTGLNPVRSPLRCWGNVEGRLSGGAARRAGGERRGEVDRASLAIVRHGSQGGGQGASKTVNVLPAALARENPRDGDLCACLELGAWLCRLIELLATWAFAFWRGCRCAVEGFNMHISRFLAGKFPSTRSGIRRGREKQLFSRRCFALLGGCGRFLRSFRSLGASATWYEKRKRTRKDETGYKL